MFNGKILIRNSKAEWEEELTNVTIAAADAYMVQRVTAFKSANGLPQVATLIGTASYL